MQEGEISSRLQYGAGWRNIIEKMHMTATLTGGTKSMGGTRSSPAAEENSGRQLPKCAIPGSCGG
jgi:hypothetical protein